MVPMEQNSKVGRMLKHVPKGMMADPMMEVRAPDCKNYDGPLSSFKDDSVPTEFISNEVQSIFSAILHHTFSRKKYTVTKIP